MNDLTHAAERIVVWLKPGRAEAITATELARVTGLSKDLVHHAIPVLRDANIPVGSCDGRNGIRGYFLIRDREDVDCALGTMRCRVKTQVDNLREAERLFARTIGATSAVQLDLLASLDAASANLSAAVDATQEAA